ncbi:MAG: hypothetical protein AAB726_00865 [Patescibacteria group bacterium]
MELLFSLPLIILYSIAFGVAMKVADLFNEHGLKERFHGNSMMFGVLCGIFGGLIVWSDIYLANAAMALMLGYIFRLRIDHRNHAVAAVIIITAFLFRGTIDLPTIIFFFLTFAIFGGIRDYLDDTLHSKSGIQKIFEAGWYLIIPPLIYSYFTGHWLVSLFLILFIVSYDVV